MPDGGRLPGWPRALKEAWAAAYVSLSPTTFRGTAAIEVPPIRVSDSRIAWLREDLDRWLDRKAGRDPVDAAPAAAQPAPTGGLSDDLAAAVRRTIGPPKRHPRRPRQTG